VVSGGAIDSWNDYKEQFTLSFLDEQNQALGIYNQQDDIDLKN
jgi:hypothetical protein